MKKRIKLDESQFHQLITDCVLNIINESSQSWLEYANKNKVEYSDDEIRDVEDKISTRSQNKYNDGKKQYQFANPYSGRIFRGANKNNINDIAKNAKRELSTKELHNNKGVDPFNNWDYVAGTEYPIKINGSQIRKAKDWYKTKNMSPKEKEEYYKKNYNGRFNTFYNEFDNWK